MEKNIYNPSKIRKEAETVNFTALLNSYCREFTNWSKYQGVPKYRPCGKP